MKPGTIQEGVKVVVVDEVRPVLEVETVQTKGRINVEDLPDGRSQLPPVPPSRTDTPGESPMVRGGVDVNDDEPQRPKGKRQKFLKVPEAKGVTKAAKNLFRLSQTVLDQGIERLRKRRDVTSEFGPEDA